MWRHDFDCIFFGYISAACLALSLDYRFFQCASDIFALLIYFRSLHEFEAGGWLGLLNCCHFLCWWIDRHSDSALGMLLREVSTKELLRKRPPTLTYLRPTYQSRTTQRNHQHNRASVASADIAARLVSVNQAHRRWRSQNNRRKTQWDGCCVHIS